MEVNGINETQSAQPERKIVKSSDQNGHPVVSIFKDVNGDGKLDLYSITVEDCTIYDNCRHEITFFDNDGDGYYDVRQEIITPNWTKDGKPAKSKTIIEEHSTKNNLTKMENILTPPERKSKINLLPNLWN